MTLEGIKINIDDDGCIFKFKNKALALEVLKMIVANETVPNGTFNRITPSSDKKSIKKQEDKITGNDVRDLIDPQTQKERGILLTTKLIDLATQRNRNKKPYNIRRTVNYIVDHAEKKEFMLPIMSDEIGLTGKTIRQHLELLNFTFDNNSRSWIKPEKWE